MIRPCIVFADHTEEAINFYVSLFPNSKVLSITRHEGKVMGATFEVCAEMKTPCLSS